MNNNKKNNNKNEMFENLFWKVINNKFLFKLIFQHIKNHSGCKCNNNNNNNSSNSNTIKNYNNFYSKNRKSFKNITSFEWMIKNNQIQLFYYKIKNKEYIKFKKDSIKEFINYYNEKINESSSVSETASTVTASTSINYIESFKEILKLLLEFKLIIIIQDLDDDNYFSKLLIETTNETTFKLALQVLNESSNFKLPDTIKNTFIHDCCLIQDNEKIETLLNFKELYNIPCTSTTQNVKLITFKELSSLNSINIIMKLIELGYLDSSSSSSTDNEGNHQINVSNCKNNEKELLKVLSSISSGSDSNRWYQIYLSKYQEIINELDFKQVLIYSLLNYNFKLFNWCLLNYDNNNNGTTLTEEVKFPKEYDYYICNQIELQKDIEFIKLYISQDKLYSNLIDIAILKSINSIENYEIIINCNSDYGISNRFKKLLPNSWNEIIKIASNLYNNRNNIYNGTDNTTAIPIDNIDTINWFMLNQNYLTRLYFCKLSLNNIKIVNYTIPKLFTYQKRLKFKEQMEKIKKLKQQQQQSIDFNFIFEYGISYYLLIQDTVRTSSILYLPSFINSINNCDINSLNYINENIIINWAIINQSEYQRIKSNLQFSNEINQNLIINLINYLNGINYKNFIDSFFIIFINSIIVSLNSISSSSSSSINEIIQRIKPSTNYLVHLLINTIEESLPINIIECLLFQGIENQDINKHPIKLNSLEIVEHFKRNEERFNGTFFRNGHIEVKNDDDDDHSYLNIIETIELIIKFNKKFSGGYGIESVCQTILQYLYNKLIKYSNVTNNQLINIYDEISNTISKPLDHNIYHSVYYLIKKSPNSITYLIKFIKKIKNYYCKLFFDDNVTSYNLISNLFTFDLIFKQSQSTDDEIYNILMNYSILNNDLKLISKKEVFSKVLNFNLKFYLSIKRIDLFFNYLNNTVKQQQQQQQTQQQQQLHDGGALENQMILDIHKQYEIKILKRIKKFVKKMYDSIPGFVHKYGSITCNNNQVIEYIKNAYFIQSLFVKKIKISSSDIYQLFDKPYYKYKEQSLHPQIDNNNNTIDNDQSNDIVEKIQTIYYKSHFKNKELDEMVNSSKSSNHHDNHQNEYSIYFNCSTNEFDCNNSSIDTTTNEMDLFNFNLDIYHKSIKFMNQIEFKEFIKFNSYRSFLQFLYSYGIKVKYLLRYYNLINHILLNHNILYKNNNQIDENINFIKNYWDQIFKFNQLNQKKIINYEMIIKSNNIQSSTILNELLSNYKNIK